ncbi:PTS sugar transporter subunit IIB [Oenococcus alcoholitolerans]|uniref:PTS sugar transporter subunit IIB n=1 Tax=Oenococcus alcoholitolerans TaxID=931074 RepID=UPI003F7151B8
MAEKTIMLCCAAGMSTSMLVARMQKAAQSQGKDYEIFATSAAEFNESLEKSKVDVVLLGPQVRYMENDFKKILEPKHIPIDIIDMQAYGLMNGEKVLEQAEGLAKV